MVCRADRLTFSSSFPSAFLPSFLPLPRSIPRTTFFAILFSMNQKKDDAPQPTDPPPQMPLLLTPASIKNVIFHRGGKNLANLDRPAGPLLSVSESRSPFFHPLTAPFSLFLPDESDSSSRLLGDAGHVFLSSWPLAGSASLPPSYSCKEAPVSFVVFSFMEKNARMRIPSPSVSRFRYGTERDKNRKSGVSGL